MGIVYCCRAENHGVYKKDSAKFASQVDELPKRLQEARITRTDFETFTDLWRKVHQLHVATDLTYNSIGHFRRDDMKVRDRSLPPHPCLLLGINMYMYNLPVLFISARAQQAPHPGPLSPLHPAHLPGRPRLQKIHPSVLFRLSHCGLLPFAVLSSESSMMLTKHIKHTINKTHHITPHPSLPLFCPYIRTCLCTCHSFQSWSSICILVPLKRWWTTVQRASKKITGKPLSDDQVDIIYGALRNELQNHTVVARAPRHKYLWPTNVGTNLHTVR